MRTRQPDCSPLYLKILFACIACPIMVWPILLRLYFELIELRARLVPVLAPFAKHSPSQITTLVVPQASAYGKDHRRALKCGTQALRHMLTSPPRALSRRCSGKLHLSEVVGSHARAQACTVIEGALEIWTV